MFILTSGILVLTFLSTFRIVFIMPTNFALIFKNIGYNLRIVRFIYNFPYNYKIIQSVVLYKNLLCKTKLSLSVIWNLQVKIDLYSENLQQNEQLHWEWIAPFREWFWIPIWTRYLNSRFLVNVKTM